MTNGLPIEVSDYLPSRKQKSLPPLSSSNKNASNNKILSSSKEGSLQTPPDYQVELPVNKVRIIQLIE